VDGFVAALRDLFDGEKLATRSSAAGREVAAYRAETVVPQFEELYERVIER
jgi:glycosyltransferase involved in cell wall biosynthesis